MRNVPLTMESTRIERLPRKQHWLIIYLTQPSTALQIARQTNESVDQARKLIGRLKSRGIVYCLNPGSPSSRLFWLTAKGKKVQSELLPNPINHDCPNIDWTHYGAICFSHRSIVVKTLRSPMQPAAIKRVATRNDPSIRFSANNCRDAIRFLSRIHVVKPVLERKKKFPRYELTESGKHMQRLLWQAEVKRF